MKGLLLVVNAGSSSIKFSVFDAQDDAPPREELRGLLEGLGSHARFTAKDPGGTVLGEHRWAEADKLDHAGGILFLRDWLLPRLEGRHLLACGHRVVHGGMAHSAPVRITGEVIQELEKLCPLAPLHQPHNLKPIRAIHENAPDLPQVACFDTAFHRNQSEVVQQYALPRAITDGGVRRYGFHGLSYEYIASVLPKVHPRLPEARVIVAHLGNGASLCAMRGGRSVATTMGFSALDGLPMGTRSGVLDPGVIFHLLRELRMTPEEAEKMLYQQSGLLGMSGVSNDMRELRARVSEPPVRLALDIYVHRIAREIGSLAAALGGLDAIVFTGGIGERSAETRAEVLAACSWLGFEIDPERHAAKGPLITRGDPEKTPSAWIVPTDEEGMIARHTLKML